MDLQNLIVNIVKLYENKIKCDFKGEEPYIIVQPAIAELIIVLTRLLFDIRSCPSKTCTCSPEMAFKELFNRYSHIYEKYLCKSDFDNIVNLTKSL